MVLDSYMHFNCWLFSPPISMSIHKFICLSVCPEIDFLKVVFLLIQVLLHFFKTGVMNLITMTLGMIYMWHFLVGILIWIKIGIFWQRNISGSWIFGPCVGDIEEEMTEIILLLSSELPLFLLIGDDKYLELEFLFIPFGESIGCVGRILFFLFHPFLKLYRKMRSLTKYL